MKPRSTHTCDVLDHGYVRLVDVMGNDLTPVNAARVSFDKESFEFSVRDKRLLAFLAREGHTSPFRHATLQFEIYAPLMVARQWWKYIIGSMHQDPLGAWNESSRRYVTEEPTFYTPTEWRAAPENKKQGSGRNLDKAISQELTSRLRDYIAMGEFYYNYAVNELGVAPEQARLFLPAYGMYVRWYWTCSLQALAHFLAQRMASDAQKEIQEYAKAVFALTKPYFQNSLRELLRHKPELQKIEEVRELVEEEEM